MIADNANSQKPGGTDHHTYSRREFLRLGGGAVTLTLSLSQFSGLLSSTFVREVFGATRQVEYRNVDDIYKSIWKWDKVTWGSHTNACLPGSCPFHVYVKNGMVWREEQSCHNAASSAKYPDYNPLGCQKGCSFHKNLYGDERIKYPLKRVGERGEGKWKRISWDEALTEIGEAIVDAIQEQGVDGFLLEPPHAHMGVIGLQGVLRMNELLGGCLPDLNVLIGDFYRGIFDTIGKTNTTFSADNLFDAELIFLSYSNWNYTMIPIYHFLTEARYNGTEIVAVNPDYNPTTVTADYHAPVKPGSDAAFWLGLCKVMIDEGLVNKQFVKEQTDLALLVRKDNGRYLRQRDLEGVGREDQLYFFDVNTKQVAKAPRGTLAFDGDQALEGSFQVKLEDGKTIEVITVYELVKKKLAQYTPEKASEKCGVHPSMIRLLGRKLGTKVTFSYIGYSSPKSYHGDLAERAMLLALALSGNWGKPGTGWNAFPLPGIWNTVSDKPVHQGGLADLAAMQQAFAQKVLAEDPEATDEIIATKAMVEMTKRTGIVSPIFFLYYHCGFKELYDNANWQDPSYKRSFSEYLDEALKKGWWTPEQVRPSPSTTPRVMMVVSSNPLRRVRSAHVLYPKHLFPKLKMIFAIDPRMSFTAMYADIVLPSAWYYEKVDMTIGGAGNPRSCMIEQAVKPPGEARPEWEICLDLVQKIGDAAARRGVKTFKDFFGQERRYDELLKKFTMDGYLRSQEDALRETVASAEATGFFPKGMTYDKFRKQGVVEQHGFGLGIGGLLAANEIDPRRPFYSLRWHVDDKKVYPTYSRRAQFYIDHEWYLEAREELPVWKELPKIGGDHPFALTGGHPRHSIHTNHHAQASLLRLHRGQPVMHMNDKDAAKRGIANGEIVRVFNDFSDFEIMVRTSPTVQPEQLIVYLWEGYQFRKWNVYDRLLIGQPKPIHLAGGYEQFRFYVFNGGPNPTADRGVRVDVQKIAKAGLARETFEIETIA